MSSLFSQICVVVMMNIRSIPQRFWMSLATLLAVAIVVAVLLAFSAMGEGFRATVQGSGSNSIAVVLREGSQAELNSSLSREQVNLMAQAPGVARDDNNGPITSGELYVIVDGIKRSSQTKANLPLRGIEPLGIQLREGITVVAGRMFEPGKNEIVVGASIQKQFEGFELGSTVRIASTDWDIVGVFDIPGSVFASELWTDTRTVQSLFNRGNSYQVMRMALATPGDVSAIEQYIADDPRLNLDVWTELKYYQEQSSATSDLIFSIGIPLAIIMAFGALAGALNTMYNSVAQRAVEMATLRAIGFSGFSAFCGTLIESLVLAIIGGLIGTLAAYVFFDGISASTLGASFSQIVFSFKLTPDAFVSGIWWALIIGLVGGVFPAWRAARLPVVTAFSANP